ncbi:MAG: RDD family protein [Thermoleophilaceae bacterium]
MSHAVRPGAAAVASGQAATPEQAGLAEPSYQGLVTRAIAFAIDAAIINLVAITVAAGVGLALSVLHIPHSLEPVLIVLGGAAYLLWSAGYFVTFWASTGETPGNRLMRIRVCMADTGEPPRPLRALLRLGALVLAVIPLFAGLLPILVDARRRGLQDMLAGTVVVAAPDTPPATGRYGFSARRSP